MITDVLNYHPFSRGHIRDPEEIRHYFYLINDQRGNIYSNKLNVEQNRVLNLPLLLNQRPPSLLYSLSSTAVKSHHKPLGSRTDPPCIGFKLGKSKEGGKVEVKHLLIEESKGGPLQRGGVLGKRRERNEDSLWESREENKHTVMA